MKAEADKRFEAILRETEPRIRAYIAGMGVSPDMVDDIAQDVFIEFYRGLGRVPERTEPVRWLKGMARNLCLNHFREQKRASGRQRAALAELLERIPSRLESSTQTGRAADALVECLGRLEEKPRRLVSLCYEHDETSAAIGRTMSMTAEAVRIALYRTRAALKKCVESTQKQGAW